MFKTNTYNLIDINVTNSIDMFESDIINIDAANFINVDIDVDVDVNTSINIDVDVDVDVNTSINIINIPDIQISENINQNNIKKNSLDKFYTNEDISKKYIDKISEFYNWDDFDFIIEPSAGAGSFLFAIPNDNKIGIDIDPEHDLIIKQDYLTYSPPEGNENILTIGNPPFGKVGSLAIKFFNHSAKFSNTIAFILPRSFRKIAIQNRLDLNFHLVYDDLIPIKPCCFNPEMKAKCCFQIWQRKDIKRNIVKTSLIHDDWEFIHYKEIENADFALRAYGGHCGDIIDSDLDKLNHKGWHFIKANINKKLLIDKMKKLNFIHSTNTARQDSIGKRELVELYNSTN